MRRFLVPVLLLVGAGCAHERSWTAVSAAGNDIEVRLRGDVAMVGERVNLYRVVCTAPGATNSAPVCHRELIGRGRVIGLVDEQHAIVRLPAGMHLENGYIVERPGV
jgi:hypothetical protein